VHVKEPFVRGLEKYYRDRSNEIFLPRAGISEGGKSENFKR
jgi:hypothetical protein